MIQTDLMEREIHPDLSHDTDSIRSGADKGMVDALEEMLAKHYDSTKTVVQHERSNYANVLIFASYSSDLTEKEQSFFDFSYSPKSIYSSLVAGHLQDKIALEKERAENEKLRKNIFAFTHDELLEFMARNDLEDYVDDYYDYLQDRQVELEEGESLGIILQSLQSWVWFLIDYALPEEIPRVKIRADFVGCVRLVWRLSEASFPNDPDNEYYGNGKGIISLTFFPSYLNYISAMTGAFGAEKRRVSFRGEFSHTMTGQIVNIFKERLLSPNA